MIINALVENTSVCKDIQSEHGLSLYIQTGRSKTLFDVGASDLFLKNAEKMNIDISDIDYLVISHGHYDHGGGLKTFLENNKKAKVFINEFGFNEHFSMRDNKHFHYIGLDESLKNHKQIIFTKDSFKIDEKMELFSNIEQNLPIPKSNLNLFMKNGNSFVNDDFSHEQVLVICEDGKTTLITGCAHNGIVNIIRHFHKLKGYMPDVVIGGFHLSSPSSNLGESNWAIDEIAKYLLTTGAKYYTCHCTGIDAYRRLKSLMGDSIDYLSAGSGMII